MEEIIIDFIATVILMLLGSLIVWGCGWLVAGSFMVHQITFSQSIVIYVCISLFRIILVTPLPGDTKK